MLIGSSLPVSHTLPHSKAFLLRTVPINIPAFAVSSNVEVDMNVELMAHGYSNGLVGMLGGMLL